MSVIHKGTTITPTKMEMLTAWLPGRPWYPHPSGTAPELAKAGGFRLDDPAGEVGLEFMAVTDTSGPEPLTLHVPLSYRGAPLDGAADALIGTCEHGVLGKRWVYDGSRDPVLVDRLLALLQGSAEPQAQSETDTPDPTVAAAWSGGAPAPAGPAADTPEGTGIPVTAGGVPAVLRIVRILRPGPERDGQVTADWHAADGSPARGAFAVLRTDG